MQITRIEQQKKDPQKSNLYIDGEYFCSVPNDILAEIKINVGMSFQEDEFQSKLEIIMYKKALRKALTLLSKAWRTAAEIKKRLQEEDYDAAAIDKVLAYLQEAGYINDGQYAEGFLKNKSIGSKSSKRNIVEKLRQKGIDRETIEEKLAESGYDEYQAAHQLAIKKIHGLKGDEQEKKQKLYGFLYRKGFSGDVCRKTVESLLQGNDD